MVIKIFVHCLCYTVVQLHCIKADNLVCFQVIFPPGIKVLFSIKQMNHTVNRHTISQTLHGKNFRIFFTPRTRKLHRLCFPTKQRKCYFHIINIPAQGYITLNKYIIGISSIGSPKVNLWASKCVTKIP